MATIKDITKVRLEVILPDTDENYEHPFDAAVKAVDLAGRYPGSAWQGTDVPDRVESGTIIVVIEEQ